MPFVFKRLALLTSIAAAFAADNGPAGFKPGPPESLPHYQTNDKVTLGAEAYTSQSKIKEAFGKIDPYKEGVLPVLIVIHNGTGKSISLEGLRAEYNGPNRTRISATPAKDVRYAKGPDRPTAIPGPAGKIKVLGKKNALADPIIDVRAFSAQMLPAGNTASGFVYFETGLQGGATLYVTGLAETPSGKELLFFEVPLGDSEKPQK